jgi:MSHA biogenesis protein MshG
MPGFTYKGRSSAGEMVQGEIDANSMSAVATQLSGLGVIPIDIKEKKVSGNFGASILKYLTDEAPGLDDLILFSRQMYTLMKAGVPMVRSFTGLIQSTRNQQMVAAQQDILSSIESGRDLSSSMSKHGNIFSTLFISMINIGENTGRLEESFLRISHYLEREKETRERIKAALRYPLFVIVAIGVAIAIINIWVIPAFAGMFSKAGVELPWQTRLLMGTSAFFVAWWHVMLVTIVGGIVGFSYYIKTEQGRYAWDRTQLRIPLAGDIIRRATLSRFARAFSMALASGVPLIQALTVVSRAVDNEYIGNHVLGMRTGIERGEAITKTAIQTKMFTPLVLQMMAVGEETGQVDEMMSEVADYYEREVDYDIKNLSAAIEPILIVSIGIMVLILAMGVFLPMWDMSTVVKS